MKHIGTMKTTNKYLLALCCFLSITFSACEAKNSSSTPSPYPVYDSGAWADPLHDPEIYWIDNNRVLFKAVKDNDKKNISRGPFNLSIWEIGKGVKVYTPYVKGVHACLRDGVFNYKVTDEPNKWHEQDKLHIYYGKFGEEKLVTPKKMSYLDLINCRVEDNPEIAEKTKAGRAIIKLLDRHGYLDIGPITGPESFENNPITLYRPDGTSVKLAARRFELHILGYSPFKDAYFFDGGLEKSQGSDFARNWPPGTLRALGWLHPDGRIEPFIIPAEPWPDKKVPNIVPKPLRNGFLVIMGKSKGPYDAGEHGGYYLHNNKFTKVIGGYLKSLTVSPDGCRVAFVHYPYFESTLGDDPSPIRLKAVDLCQKNEEKTHGQ